MLRVQTWAAASAACVNTLASAAALILSAVTKRPLYGELIFCQLHPDRLEMDLAVAVHEVMHVLVRLELHAVTGAPDILCAVPCPTQARGLQKC